MRQMCCLAMFFGSLLGALAHGPSCSVTQTDEQVTYRVTAFTATHCIYSWSNDTNHVLANEAEEPKYPVMERSQELLTTKQCILTVSYRRDCLSEGTPVKIVCNANCSGNAGLRKRDGGTRSYSTAVIVAVSSVLLVVLVIVIIIIIVIIINYSGKTKDSGLQIQVDEWDVSEEEVQQGE